MFNFKTVLITLLTVITLTQAQFVTNETMDKWGDDVEDMDIMWQSDSGEVIQVLHDDVLGLMVSIFTKCVLLSDSDTSYETTLYVKTPTDEFDITMNYTMTQILYTEYPNIITPKILYTEDPNIIKKLINVFKTNASIKMIVKDSNGNNNLFVVDCSGFTSALNKMLDFHKDLK